MMVFVMGIVIVIVGERIDCWAVCCVFVAAVVVVSVVWLMSSAAKYHQRNLDLVDEMSRVVSLFELDGHLLVDAARHMYLTIDA